MNFAKPSLLFNAASDISKDVTSRDASRDGSKEKIYLFQKQLKIIHYIKSEYIRPYQNAPVYEHVCLSRF